MIIVGQADTPNVVMDAASKHSWEAGLLALIVVSGFAAFGWTLKVIMQRHLSVEERTLTDARDREIRLAGRVTTLEDLVRGELLALIRTNSETMGKVLSAADSICRASDRMVQTLDRFTSVLAVRPCFHRHAFQATYLRSLNCSYKRLRSVLSRRILQKPLSTPWSSRIPVVMPSAQKYVPSLRTCQRSSLA